MRKNVKKLMQKCLAFLVAVVMVGTVITPVTPVQAKTGNSADNIISEGYAGNPCRYGNSIYYSVYNKLYRFDTKTKKTKLVKTISGFSLSSINVYSGTIYLTVNKFIGTGGSDTYIYSLKTNGSGLKKLAKGRNCHVADGMIYYIQTKAKFFGSERVDDPNVSDIYRMRLNGTGKKKLRSAKYCNNLFVYGSRIYYQAYANRKNYLYSMKKDGSQNRTEAAGSSYSWVGADGGYLYYAKENWNKNSGHTESIYRKKSGSGKSELVISGVKNVSVSGSNLYYLKGNGIDGTANTVYKKNMGTKKTSKIASGKGWYIIHACGSWLCISKFLNEGSYNHQIVVMTANGKYKKNLQKCYFS